MTTRLMVARSERYRTVRFAREEVPGTKGGELVCRRISKNITAFNLGSHQLQSQMENRQDGRDDRRPLARFYPCIHLHHQSASHQFFRGDGFINYYYHTGVDGIIRPMLQLCRNCSRRFYGLLPTLLVSPIFPWLHSGISHHCHSYSTSLTHHSGIHPVNKTDHSRRPLAEHLTNHLTSNGRSPEEK